MTILSLIDKTVNSNSCSIPITARALASKLRMTFQQAWILAFFVSLSENKHILLSEVAKKIGISYIQLLDSMQDIEFLVSKHYIGRNTYNGCETYYVVQEAMNCMINDKPYFFSYKDLKDDSSIFKAINNTIKNARVLEDSQSYFEDEIQNIISNCARTTFVKQVLKPKLDNESLCVLIYIANALFSNNDDNVTLDEMDDIFDCLFLRQLSFKFNDGSHILIEKGFVESQCESGMCSQKYFHLTSETKKKFFPELVFSPDPEEDIALYCIRSNKIIEKKLFYNKDTKNEVAKLTKILKQRSFKQITKRLAEKSMSNGLTCLLYGSPGTGKTELVKQLAKITGRDIYKVDTSALRDKYVGESEKIIKSIFDQYRVCSKKADICPILLFNEADAVFSKRIEDCRDSTDQMSNTVQNIILEELENFEGILIATTNLSSNFDSAFERRFLFKLKFDKPDAITRTAIWNNKLPQLSRKEAMMLGKAYTISGANVENVARKEEMNYILYGKYSDYADICKLCESEINNKEHNSIGFKK